MIGALEVQGWGQGDEGSGVARVLQMEEKTEMEVRLAGDAGYLLPI